MVREGCTGLRRDRCAEKCTCVECELMRRKGKCSQSGPAGKGIQLYSLRLSLLISVLHLAAPSSSGDTKFASLSHLGETVKSCLVISWASYPENRRIYEDEDDGR